MAKIENDKYYTQKDLAKYCVEKAKEVIGQDNITEWLEPSAGSGNFLDYLENNYLAYDILPEDDRIVKQDYLELDLEYKKGRCIIGNPPYGTRNNLYRKFYNKSIELGDYICFVSPIKLMNNTRQIYKFDLIYSEDLGKRDYSGVKLHCCFNIYRRPKNGLNKQPKINLSDIDIYREDEKKYKHIVEDFKICRMGQKTWKILDEGQELRNFKIVVNNKKFLYDVKSKLEEKYNYYLKHGEAVISTPYIAKADIYKYIKEQIPEIQ